ncbi:MAG: DNA-formamidopyrimidine glycosylase family protein [Chloroflexota bacterium]|jgi:formamidopyrimidine-DNA glycosylase
MPELPDVTIYVERLQAMVQGQRLATMRIGNPFVLRTYEPQPDAFTGCRLQDVDRIGKRIVLGFEGDLYVVMHLMIAGRLRWRPLGAALHKKQGLAAFDFENGSLLFTEAGSKRRAALHLVAGAKELATFDRGGVNVLAITAEEFGAALRRENRTLKRALTDPSIVDGVGNAYSDEILHRARLSPFKLTQNLTEDEIAELQQAAIAVLNEWIERFREEVGAGFPQKVIALRPEMTVHGKYRQPCPVCGAPVQRIVYAQNEANYCPICQTGGRLLKDRALSRLLREDWPKTLEELEQRTTNR